MASKPDEVYITALAAELQTHYKKDDDQIKALRDLRHQTNAVAMPDELRRVDGEMHDPLIANEIAQVVASISQTKPQCRVVPFQLGDEGERNATLRETWTEEVLRVAGARIPGMITFEAVVDACVSDGGAWSKLLFMPDTWEALQGIKLSDFDEEVEESGTKKKRANPKAYLDRTEKLKQTSGPPFIWLPVDAMTIYPVWDGGRISEVVEITEVPALRTMRKYDLMVDRSGKIVERLGQPLSEQDAKRIPTTVKRIEHWDDKYCTYVLQGGRNKVVVEQFEHGYKRPPYFYAPGIVANHWRGRKVGWGIAQSKRWLVEFREFLMTLILNAASQDVGRNVFHELPDNADAYVGEDGKPYMFEDLPMNSIIHGRPGEKMTPVLPEALSPAFQQLLTLTNEMIDSVTVPHVSGEIGGSGMDGAGFAISQVLNEVRTRYSPFVVHLQRMFIEITEFMWWLVRNRVKEDVWVHYAPPDEGNKKSRAKYLGAGPNDLSDGVGVSWVLDPAQPSSRLIEARYWHERVQAGTASMDQAIGAMGDDPDEVRQGRALDRMRNTDWYVAYQDRIILQNLGRGDLLAQAAQIAAQTGQLPGMPPQGGPPGMAPPAAPGGMGNGQVMDMGRLAAAPNGQGMAPPNGSVPGAGPGAVVPQQAAAAGVPAGGLR